MRIVEAGKIMETAILDHVIIAGNNAFSVKGKGKKVVYGNSK
jgi:DNA repair protein RadC